MAEMFPDSRNLVRVLTAVQWLITCFLSAAYGYPHQQKTCGTSLSGLHGTFKSPNFPESYPDNLKCSWNITVPAGHRISINFTQFDTENYVGCTYDYVVVSEKNKTIGRFCGKEGKLDSHLPRGPLYVESNSAIVDFITDHSNEEVFHGFDAHFAAHDVDECANNNGGCMHFCNNYIGGYYCSCRIGYDLDRDGKTCLVQCKGVILKDKTGVIQSPEYPNNYPPHADCEWTVIGEKGYSINLEFEDFNIEKHPDYPCPYDWLRIESENGDFKTLCGDKKPDKITTNEDWLLITFHSDNDESKKGFRIKYSLAGVKCLPLTAPTHGSLLGPSTFEYKDKIHFSCDKGYELVGEQILTCTVKGEWTAKPPTCRIRSCGEPKLPVGGSYEGSALTYGSSIKYKCDVLYNLIGSDTSTCLANGTWSGEMPYCKPICGRTKFPSHKMQACKGRAVGGQVAPRGGHPWLAAVLKHGRAVCGGSLLNEEWVLTAAHCVTNAKGEVLSRDSLSVGLGVHNIRFNDTNVQYSTVAEVIKHPSFSYSDYNADAALLRLSTKAKMTNYVRPVCLPSVKREKMLFRSGRNTLAAGWGRTTFQRSADTVNEVCVPLASRSDCEKAFQKDKLTITPMMFCAGKPNSFKNVCQGDSGGPLVAYDDSTKKWILGGIVSWGSTKNCGENYEVFARVTKLVKWVKENAIFDLRNPFSETENEY